MYKQIFIFLLFIPFLSLRSQETQKETILSFKLNCNHLQTTIVADQSIMIYIMSLDYKKVVKSTAYCSRKELKIPHGSYAVIIESSKYCTHELKPYLISEKEQQIEVDLLRETDPECTMERNFEPHPTRFD